MTIRQAKRRMRREVVARVRAMDSGIKRTRDAALGEILPTLPGFESARTVLLYASAFPEEIDTGPMIGLALEIGKRVVLPRVDRERSRLDLFMIEDPGRDLETGVLGIAEPHRGLSPVEPSQVDWVLMPGVAFDQLGGRLGRGGGYYDRLLPELRAGVARWALAYDEQVVPEVPTEPHDQRIDGVATAS